MRINPVAELIIAHALVVEDDARKAQKLRENLDKKEKKKPAKSACPRERFHRPNSYCKFCDRLIK